MGAPEPLPKLVQDAIDQQVRLTANLQKKLDALTAPQRAAQQAALRAAAKKEADFRSKLAPWNPNVFRMDGRIDTDAAVKRINEALAADPALADRRMKELQQRTEDVAKLRDFEGNPLNGEDPSDRVERLDRAIDRRDGTFADPKFLNTLNSSETDALRQALAHPSQWGETGTMQVGRFTVEISVNAPASTGDITQMTTSSGADRTSSTSQESQSSSGHTMGRSIELGVTGDQITGKAGGSEGTTTTVTSGHGHAESTASHQGTQTTNPGERKQTEMFAIIKDGHGTDVRVSLGTVLVAQQK